MEGDAAKADRSHAGAAGKGPLGEPATHECEAKQDEDPERARATHLLINTRKPPT